MEGELQRPQQHDFTADCINQYRAMSTNALGLIVSIIMIFVFVIAWAAAETKRRNKASLKYRDADPQLRNDMLNKIIRMGMPRSRSAVHAAGLRG
jgi:predicted negative regulator of RcsB-dependent stress response